MGRLHIRNVLRTKIRVSCGVLAGTENCGMTNTSAGANTDRLTNVRARREATNYVAKCWAKRPRERTYIGPIGAWRNGLLIDIP